MQHPDITRVQKLIESIMAESRYFTWRLDKLLFEYFPSAYVPHFTNGQSTITFKIPTELFDEIFDAHDPFKARKLKTMIKGLLPEEDPQARRDFRLQRRSLRRRTRGEPESDQT